MNKESKKALLVGSAILVVGLGFTYLLALAGEPQSLWLWRDVFGAVN